MSGPDRKKALLAQTSIAGIDFVAVSDDQQTLDVFFMPEPPVLAPPLMLAASDVKIAGEDDPSVPLASVAWDTSEGRNVLRIKTTRPGGFGRYWLTLANGRIDPFFSSVEISFKAACPRDIDCAPPPHVCPPREPDPILVDGSARDFWSLRRALLDFASQRNPRWQDRLEADLGVMMVELMAALGDELAFYQDRVARETQFDSATQRRSVRRHARLVDYELKDGLGARGWIAVTVSTLASPTFQLVPAGTGVWARSEGGRVVGFEVGNGLKDLLGGVTFRVHNGRNKLPAHLWEGDEPDPLAGHRPLPATCLPVGATSVHVQGHVAALFKPGESVFLVTEPPPAQRDMPVRRVLVTLVDAKDETDPLGTALLTGSDITRLTWKEPIPFEMNLEWLSVLGNAVPVTAGVTTASDFSIGPNTLGIPRAVERIGPDGSTAYLHTLPVRLVAEVRALAKLPPLPDDVAYGEDLVQLGPQAGQSVPEIALVEVVLPANVEGLPDRWSWRQRILTAEAEDEVFTLDDGSWQRAVGYQRLGGEIVHYDYIANVGKTLRFGDGEFGHMPVVGTTFRVRYRLGNGARGNVPADAVRWADPSGKKSFSDFGVGFIDSVTNPLATSGGVDAETLAEAKRDAPEAFRQDPLRAVRPEDYDALADKLPWVQRAGTQFRWTGSWLTAFTTADPRHQDDLPVDERIALTRYLDRYRMAGREVHVLAPHYADLRLKVTICVEDTSYPAEVRAAVEPALKAFFDPDNFTFGTPLDRSELETAIQRVPGVRAVKAITIERTGRFTERAFVEAYYKPGTNEVIRVDNDPLHPDRGSVQLFTEGGA